MGYDFLQKHACNLRSFVSSSLHLRMRKHFFIFLLLLFAVRVQAADADTVSIYSNAMQKTGKSVVITPKKTKGIKAWPVVYLLHGYSGNYSNWIIKVPQLKQWADQYKLMIVCPDGDYSSWYFDSPVDSTMRYETYIAKEIPAYIDAHFPTIRNNKARAITGLSMGGHGGLFLGLRHSEIFGACGSMSGGVDISAIGNKFDLMKRVGDTITNAANWKKLSVINLVDSMPASPPAMIIDCGTEDFFYNINHALHEKMLKLKIPHDYIERPGKHDWNYWTNAVQYQLLYFSRFFSGK
jgi:S-formylglutathione hydrolase FrmB